VTCIPSDPGVHSAVNRNEYQGISGAFI
jgi:hypothetical protein